MQTQSAAHEPLTFDLNRHLKFSKRILTNFLMRTKPTLRPSPEPFLITELFFFQALVSLVPAIASGLILVSQFKALNASVGIYAHAMPQLSYLGVAFSTAVASFASWVLGSFITAVVVSFFSVPREKNSSEDALIPPAVADLYRRVALAQMPLIVISAFSTLAPGISIAGYVIAACLMDFVLRTTDMQNQLLARRISIGLHVIGALSTASSVWLM